MLVIDMRIFFVFSILWAFDCCVLNFSASFAFSFKVFSFFDFASSDEY